MKFIINTITLWDEPPRARHQVAYGLSEFHPVTFISANKIGFPKLLESTINENLTVITPYFPVDFRIRYRIPIINELYQHWLFSILKKKYSQHRVINFDFTATRVFKYFSHVMFYCNDDFWGISKKYNPFPISNYLLKCIDQINKNSEFCVGISDLIVEKLKRYNSNSFLINLGGPDPSKIEFKPSLSPSKDNKTIHCGLVGFITSRNTSLAILNRLLELPNIELTIIGPIEKNLLLKLKGLNNVNIKGIMTGEALFEEINNFDVAIAPYNVKQMNEGGTPNKLWQYLAMGKPVVMTELVAIKDWKFKENMVYVSKSDDEFNNLIMKAFGNNSSDLISERIKFASDNSWGVRIRELLNIYNSNVVKDQAN